MANTVTDYAKTHSQKQSYVYNTNLFVGKLISREEYESNHAHIAKLSSNPEWCDKDNQRILRSW